MRTPFIAGNWKMYKTTAEAVAFAETLKELYHDTDVRVAICAPFTQLMALKQAFAGTKIGVGAQNVHEEQEGAFTGEISIPMLEEIGVEYCIVGHSERRQYFGETDEAVNHKLKALMHTQITPILCVGETLAEREADRAETVVSGQVRKAFDGLTPEQAVRTVIAYEPVWAIGTGKTATPQEAGRMCACIRQTVETLYQERISAQIVIQYGGSVKPENVASIMQEEAIDGALVGGASLDATKFMEIINF